MTIVGFPILLPHLVKLCLGTKDEGTPNEIPIERKNPSCLDGSHANHYYKQCHSTIVSSDRVIDQGGECNFSRTCRGLGVPPMGLGRWTRMGRNEDSAEHYLDALLAREDIR